MESINDLLLKLHYLKLEVNSIYRILLKLYQYQEISESILKKVLKSHFDAYKKLSLYKIKEQIYSNGVRYTSILNQDYPQSLQTIFMPPLILFYKGDYSLIHNKSIAVIGSRKNSRYGEQACDLFVRGLVDEKLIIVSGLARGIDTIAHQKALLYGGRTIAVLGSGLCHIYPKENRELANQIADKHLLISEYQPFEPPLKTHFPFRNRIVSGLANGVLVIEANQRSGTLITCDYALDQNKDVYVVPGNIFNETSVGTNHLIKQGAKCVTEIYDILEFFVK